MKKCKIINKKILNFLIINTLIFLISIIKESFGPLGFLKLIKKKKKIYITKNIILIIELVCKSNPVIYPLVLMLKENNVIVGDGNKILILFLSEIISKSLMNFLFQNKKKNSVSFLNCILKSIDILNFSRIKISKHLTEFLFLFIFNCLETTCYSKVAKNIAFEIVSFFSKICMSNKKPILNKIGITSIKIGSIFDLLLFYGFIYSEQDRNRVNKKLLKNNGLFICINKVSESDFYLIYKFFLNRKDKNFKTNNIIILTTSYPLSKLNSKWNCKGLYLLGNFKKEFLLKISSNLRVPLIHSFTTLESKLLFWVDKIFEYELFGSSKLFFQKKNKCRYLSIVILSSEKVIRTDLKSTICKIIKSYINVIDYQFLIYGAGYLEMLISKYLLKIFFSELYINPIIINIYLEALMSIPRLLLKNLNLRIDYFFKLISYFTAGNNTFAINNNKKCYSLVKYTHCFEALVNKEFLFNITMTVINEFSSLNSLIIFF